MSDSITELEVVLFIFGVVGVAGGLLFIITLCLNSPVLNGEYVEECVSSHIEISYNTSLPTNAEEQWIDCSTTYGNVTTYTKCQVWLYSPIQMEKVVCDKVMLVRNVTESD